jgi:hypothetical protein
MFHFILWACLFFPSSTPSSLPIIKSLNATSSCLKPMLYFILITGTSSLALRLFVVYSLVNSFWVSLILLYLILSNKAIHMFRPAITFLSLASQYVPLTTHFHQPILRNYAGVSCILAGSCLSLSDLSSWHPSCYRNAL